MTQQVFHVDFIRTVLTLEHVKPVRNRGREQIHDAVLERQLPFLDHPHHHRGDKEFGDTRDKPGCCRRHGLVVRRPNSPRTRPVERPVPGGDGQNCGVDPLLPDDTIVQACRRLELSVFFMC